MSFANFDDMRNICLELCEEETRVGQKDPLALASLAAPKETKKVKYTAEKNKSKSY
jgi:hypothetical protein